MSPSDPRQPRTQWGRLAGMGFEFGAAVGVFTLLGWWVDYHWGIERHWGTVIGALIGLIGGGYNFMREAMRALRDSERQGRRQSSSQPAAPDNMDKDGRS